MKRKPSSWPIDQSGSVAASAYELALKTKEARPLVVVENLLSDMLTQPHVVVKDGVLYLFAMEGNWCANVRG